MADYLRIARAALADLKAAEPNAASATPGESPKIEAESDPEEVARARALVCSLDVRTMQVDGSATVGVWSDLDRLQIRLALRTLGLDQMPLRYLDGAGIPLRYKLRRVEGEPVPMNVLAEMDRLEAIFMQCGHRMLGDASMSGERPWEARDRMLSEMSWSPEGISWAEWKAATLNRLFLEQGATGKMGRITAKTVCRGEQMWAAKRRNEEPEIPSSPERRRATSAHTTTRNARLKDDSRHPGKHIDPETGVWPIGEWSGECGRGLPGNAR